MRHGARSNVTKLVRSAKSENHAFVRINITHTHTHHTRAHPSVVIYFVIVFANTRPGSRVFYQAECLSRADHMVTVVCCEITRLKMTYRKHGRAIRCGPTADQQLCAPIRGMLCRPCYLYSRETRPPPVVQFGRPARRNLLRLYILSVTISRSVFIYFRSQYQFVLSWVSK